MACRDVNCKTLNALFRKTQRLGMRALSKNAVFLINLTFPRGIGGASKRQFSVGGPRQSLTTILDGSLSLCLR